MLTYSGFTGGSRASQYLMPRAPMRQTVQRSPQMRPGGTASRVGIVNPDALKAPGALDYGSTYSTTIAKATGDVPVTTTQATDAAQTGFSLSDLDFQSDPILQKVIAEGNRNLTAARAQHQEEQKRLLLGFGSQELARKLYGESDPIMAMVSADPDRSFSTLARIAHQYRVNQGDLNNELAIRNLFYSSHRGNELQALARGRQEAETDASGQMELALGAARERLMNIEAQVRASVLAAQEAAFLRALQLALSRRRPGGGSDTSDDPSDDPSSDPSSGTTPPPTDTGIAQYVDEQVDMGGPQGFYSGFRGETWDAFHNDPVRRLGVGGRHYV